MDGECFSCFKFVFSYVITILFNIRTMFFKQLWPTGLSFLITSFKYLIFIPLFFSRTIKAIKTKYSISILQHNWFLRKLYIIVIIKIISNIQWKKKGTYVLMVWWIHLTGGLIIQHNHMCQWFPTNKWQDKCYHKYSKISTLACI